MSIKTTSCFIIQHTMDIVIVFKFIFLSVAAYLLGSIPSGLVLTRRFGNVDIRSTGSGNIGATNVLRTSGKLLAAATLAADILKGAIPVWYALFLGSSSDISRDLFISVVALAAFFGHLFPVYSKFRHGGKGVATALGGVLAISPATAAIVMPVFILAVWMTRRVSVGSLAAAGALPLFIALTNNSPVLTGYAILVAISIWICHRQNIVRLIQGKEPVLGRKT